MHRCRLLATVPRLRGRPVVDLLQPRSRCGDRRLRRRSPGRRPRWVSAVLSGWDPSAVGIEVDDRRGRGRRAALVTGPALRASLLFHPRLVHVTLAVEVVAFERRAPHRPRARSRGRRTPPRPGTSNGRRARCARRSRRASPRRRSAARSARGGRPPRRTRGRRGPATGGTCRGVLGAFDVLEGFRGLADRLDQCVIRCRHRPTIAQPPIVSRRMSPAEVVRGI